LIESTPGRFVAGPEVDEWRCKKTKTREGGSSAKYLAAKKVREEIMARDWEVRTGKRREVVDLTTSANRKRQQLATEDDLRMQKGTLTPTEYAVYLGLHVETILRRVRTGQIPKVPGLGRTIRIPITHLAEAVNVKVQEATK
jgi:excisionase family DNA binding protein